MVEDSKAMELHSLSNIWEARTVQHELAKHRVCWVAEGQNEFSVGRYGLGVLDSEIDKFLTDWSEARAGLEDVGKIFHSGRASWGQKAEPFLVL
jgi:hypothetical protein